LLCAALLILNTGCDREEFNNSPDFRLGFSTDTVSFDTIFQSIGSSTRTLKIYNRSDEFIVIDRVSIIDSCDSYDPFRMNVDGISGSTVRDVEIGPNDSAFVFVEVTIDPNQLCNALEVGVIEFLINGNLQYVTLFAFGLDAIFYTPTVTVDGLPPYTLINPNASTITWTAEKPIVVYGYAVVDSLQKLIIEPGTNIYFHAGGGLWIFEGGTVESGQLNAEPVVFQGDRLESFFDEEPGQWDRIWISGGAPPGNNNIFRNTVIKNNFFGIQAESSPFFESTINELVDNKLILENVAIRNNSGASLFSRNYRIEGSNLSLSSAGQYCLLLTGAGEYDFSHATIANNWNASTRQTPAVFINNFDPFVINEMNSPFRDIDDARFVNCIFHGNGFNEFGIDFETGSNTVDLEIRNTLIRMQEDDFNELDQSYFGSDIFVGFDPGFRNFSEGNFRLREDAFVRSRGATVSGLPSSDLIGTPYLSPRPLGCFEYLPE
jgi:hypothetical protein